MSGPDNNLNKLYHNRLNKIKTRSDIFLLYKENDDLPPTLQDNDAMSQQDYSTKDRVYL